MADGWTVGELVGESEGNFFDKNTDHTWRKYYDDQYSAGMTQVELDACLK